MLFLDENNFRSKYIFPIDYHVFVLNIVSATQILNSITIIKGAIVSL